MTIAVDLGRKANKQTNKFKNENFATFIFVVKDIFNLQSKTSKDFLTSFSNWYLNILIIR